MEDTLELLIAGTQDSMKSSINETCAAALVNFIEANEETLLQFDIIAGIQILLGTTGIILGTKVLKSVIINYKNAITTTMVLCMVWHSLMLLSQGVLMLARKALNSISFIILYKCAYYGLTVIMSCDFLVATLFLKNAVSLHTAKVSSSLLNKLCLFTWIFFPITLLITFIIDITSTTKYLKNNSDSQSAITYFICSTGNWHLD
jgi:hypothetical protein